MAPGQFFTSWQLWEEMTFVLAMGIVIVFFSGLLKLWSSNRHMRRVEQLDAEKQARVTNMRNSGLSPNGKMKIGREIPFGVNALINGVEVDGIWVAKQASLATQPPNRKWSSRRKTKTPNSLFEMSDLTGSIKRGRMSSKTTRKPGKIFRNEIVSPCQQTREKLENLILLEERDRTGDTTNGVPTLATSPRHKGPLGRIQRELRRIASETWHDQDKSRDDGRVNAEEFHRKAQSKKPQRFYPGSATVPGSTMPLAAPTARSHVATHRLDDLLTIHGASQAVGRMPTGGHSQNGHVKGKQPTASRGPLEPANLNRVATARQDQRRQSRQRGPNESRSSSAGSFVATRESTAPVQIPGTHFRRSSEHRGVLREPPIISVRTSSRGSGHHPTRTSIDDRRSSVEHPRTAAQPDHPSAEQASRYPPNSSRSGPVMQQPQPSGSRRSSGEVYVDACRRKANEGFDIVSSDSFAPNEDHQCAPVPRSEPVSAAASVRSSMESQTSSYRGRRLQKKRSSQS